MWIVTGYLKFYCEFDWEFYELFPGVIEKRIKDAYYPEGQCVDYKYHSIDDKPIIRREGECLNISWYTRGLLHRDNGPAQIIICFPKYHGETLWEIMKETITVIYYRRGRIHRADGPANMHGGIGTHYLYGAEVPDPFCKYDKRIQLHIDFVPTDIRRKYYRISHLGEEIDDDQLLKLHLARIEGYKAWAALAEKHRDTLFLNPDFQWHEKREWKKVCDAAKLEVKETVVESKNLGKSAAAKEYLAEVAKIMKHVHEGIKDLATNSTPRRWTDDYSDW